VPTSPDLWWLGSGNVNARVASPRPDASDLRVTITDHCTAVCPAGPMQVAVQVANYDVAASPAGVGVSLYTNDEAPRLLATAVLDEVPPGVALEGLVLTFPLADVAHNATGPCSLSAKLLIRVGKALEVEARRALVRVLDVVVPRVR